MRLNLFLGLAVAVFCHNAPLHGDDGLFTLVSMESVFDGPGVTAAASSRTNTEAFSATSTFHQSAAATDGFRVTGLSGLTMVVQAAELPYAISGQRVDFDFETAGWRFPVSLSVDSKRDRILCEIFLVEVAEPQTTGREPLRKLIASTATSQEASFQFDPVAKLVRLQDTLSTRNVTATSLLKDLHRLGRFADSQADLWSELGTTGGWGIDLSRLSDAASPARPPDAIYSLIGRWSARVSRSEAMAIQFDSQGRFALVHVRDGNSTQSTGQASRSGDRLVLSGNRSRELNCRLTWHDANSFQLQVLDSAGKPTASIDFNKQS